MRQHTIEHSCIYFIVLRRGVGEETDKVTVAPSDTHLVHRLTH